jgi:trans-2,3-dihydro-3-hydroxyanthranilate isomerase
MGAYLWRYGLIEQPEFLAEQGHWMDRPGQAWVQVAGSPQDIETVRVGGPAVAVLRGELSVPDGARPGTRQVGAYHRLYP